MRRILTQKIGALLVGLLILVALPGCQTAPETEETITVMTYNVLAGAGADTVSPDWQEHAAQKGFHGNRLSRVLEVIRAAEPDILGIQEATQWDIGSPSVAQRLADELGMNYFIAESNDKAGVDLHVVLFTKFDIKEAESYPAPITKSALRAELVTPNGESIHVCVVHLHHADMKMRMTELLYVLDDMESYVDDLTIIMGDMNFPYRMRRFIELIPPLPIKYVPALREARWCHCAGQSLDQVWTSPALEPYSQPGQKIPFELTKGTSDHNPVVAKIGIPPR